MNATIREARVRRDLRNNGYRLWKVREHSNAYWEYGPYSVIDVHINVIVLKGLEMDEVEHWAHA